LLSNIKYCKVAEPRQHVPYGRDFPFSGELWHKRRKQNFPREKNYRTNTHFYQIIEGEFFQGFCPLCHG
jgi:hypothetical protein